MAAEHDGLWGRAYFDTRGITNGQYMLGDEWMRNSAEIARRYGFETNGVGFYLFDQIASPKEFKETYRDQLDAVAWDDAERERVIAEVLAAYRLNTELFDDLAAAKAAA